MTTTPFTDWELRPELQAALVKEGFTDPTSVQQEAFGPVLAGRDLLVQSRTGTGKTLAFGLPMLQRIETGPGPVEALIVLPTRELAMQVANALGRIARNINVNTAVLYGGGSYRDQHMDLQRGARLVVGTPGRLIDHIERGSLKLDKCKVLVLDEADEILDMGFTEELDKILAALPKERQSLLFSATMAPETRKLADKTLNNPQTIAVSSGLTSAPEIRHVSYEVFRENRIDALVNVLHAERPDLAIVFCHTKAETQELSERLRNEGFKSSYLNGDLPQAERSRTLNSFRRRQINILVATDVAARGIDVKGVTHVFNLGVPQAAETYIHRVGRTGRAGAAGTAVTLVPPRDAGRFRMMLQRSGIKIETLPLPQADDVRKRLRERYHEIVAHRLQVGGDERLRTLAAELLAYIEPAELVTALLEGDDLARATFEAGLDIAVPRAREPVKRGDAQPRVQIPAKAPPRPGKREREAAKGDGDGLDGEGKKPQRKLSEHYEPGMTRLHLNMGKSQQLTPGRLVQLVCKASGVKGEVIGAIAIHPHFSFFDVKEKVAEQVASALTGLNHKGKKLKANMVPVGQGQ